MGVDYNPFVFVGWALSDDDVEKADPGLPPDADENDEGAWAVVERLERVFPECNVRLGGAHVYGGSAEFYLSIRDADTIEGIRSAVLESGVASTRTRAALLGIQLGEPRLGAALRVW